MSTEKTKEVLRLWKTVLAFPKVYGVLKVLVGDPLDKTIEITNEVLESDVSTVEPAAASPGKLAMNAAGSIFIDDEMLWWPTERLTVAQEAAMRRALEIVNEESR